ncbi:MAG: phosphonate ABC transporter, permease protein PhnE [Actinomycetota bacterium]|nr:phosphonate ABC transporter, permease protein PhnE [Actinomycetota bacterium]
MTLTATRSPTATSQSRPARPRRSLFWSITLVVTAALILWAAAGLDARWARLVEAPADMWRLAELMFGNMTWSDLGSLVRALWDSIAIAWLGTVLAAAVAVPLAFVGARNLGGSVMSLLIRQVFNLLRAVPEVILVIAFIPIFGISLRAGVLAIAIGSIGTVGKLCAEILEGIDEGPLEAADAAGANGLQRMRWGVLPQALPELTSLVLYRFEINIRVSAVLGAVGAGGIGSDLVQALRFKEFGQAGLALIIVVLGTIAVDMISGWVRRRIIAGPRGERRRGEIEPDALAADALAKAL